MFSTMQYDSGKVQIGYGTKEGSLLWILPASRSCWLIRHLPHVFYRFNPSYAPLKPTNITLTCHSPSSSPAFAYLLFNGIASQPHFTFLQFRYLCIRYLFCSTVIQFNIMNRFNSAIGPCTFQKLQIWSLYFSVWSILVIILFKF